MFLRRVFGSWIGPGAVAGLLSTALLQAGPSGLNTVVVVNALSHNSLDLGNYYCEKRLIPPENVVRIEWSGSNIVWSSNQFEMVLLGPILDVLESRGLRRQVDCVVLSMDIPFQTRYGQSLNSTTSALFYGMKDSGGPNWLDVTNSYYASEAVFAEARPASNPGYAFLTAMLTGPTLAAAKRLVDQGIAGDGTLPGAPVVLAKSSDPLRNGRYQNFDNAVFNSKFWRQMSIIRTNSDVPYVVPALSGYQTGLANVDLKPGTFVPGSIADSLTSYGGIIFGPNDQTTLLAFIAAGAAGSYGTVTEPSTSLGKFPDPRVYNYQSRGFSLVECYYQSLYDPHEGLIVAEPLSAPFARPGFGLVTGSSRGLSGAASFDFTFSPADPSLPLSDVDLFIDGKLHSRVLQVRPEAGNRLRLALNGYPISITVPPNATLAAVSSNLAAEINLPRNLDATGVRARRFGDRIELRSAASGPQDLPYFFQVPIELTSSQVYYRAEALPELPPPLVSAARRHASGSFQMELQSADRATSVIDASQDLVHWDPLATNYSGGLWDFVDEDAPSFPRRFYRVRAEAPAVRPLLHVNPFNGEIHIQACTNYPYQLQASSDLASWTAIYSNASGASVFFRDPDAGLFQRRFYRVSVTMPRPSPLRVEAHSYSASEGLLLKVNGATWPFVLSSSADMLSWQPMHTNFFAGRLRTEVASEPGDAGRLSTFLAASKPLFLDSIARGRVSCSVNGSLQPGSWLGLSVLKTNGQRVSVFATNQAVAGTIQTLSSNLVSLINASPELQQPDGIMGEDLSGDMFGGSSFNLAARSEGRAAANLQVQWLSSPGVLAKPSGIVALLHNLSDLQPRNQLAIRCGATSVAGKVAFDTTELPDGPHTLTLVAYEGTHVRTQTRATLPITVRNSGLAAQLEIVPPAGDPMAGAFCQITVRANSPDVKKIRVYSTGGLVTTIVGRQVGTFDLNPNQIGAGLHPFYAIVESASGSCRTPTQWARFYR